MTTTLGHIKGINAAQLVRNALFNNMGVNAGIIPISTDDCVITYQVITDQRITKQHAAESSAYVRGMKEAFNALEFTR